MIKTNMCWTRVRHVLNIRWTHVEQMLKTCWKLFHIEQSVRSSDCAIVTRDKVNSRIESAVQECISFVAVKFRDHCFCFLINDNAWRYAPNSECLFLYRSNDLIRLSFHYLLIVYLIWRHYNKNKDQEWKNANTCEYMCHCHFWNMKQKALNRLCCLYVKHVANVLHGHVRSWRLTEDALSFDFIHQIDFFDFRNCHKTVLNVRLHHIKYFSVYKIFFSSQQFTVWGSAVSATCSNKLQELLCSDCVHYQSSTCDKILICSECSNSRKHSIRCSTLYVQKNNHWLFAIMLHVLNCSIWRLFDSASFTSVK